MHRFAPGAEPNRACLYHRAWQPPTSDLIEDRGLQTHFVGGNAAPQAVRLGAQADSMLEMLSIIRNALSAA